MAVETTPFKRSLRWKAVAMKDIRGNGTNFVPRIVEREEAITLQELVYNAIDTGRIAGIKPSAAGSVADALCEQIGATLNSGHGVKFGQYFYVRLYLTGTLDPRNPVLTDDNQLRTRLVAGSALQMKTSDFDWVNTETEGAPTIERILSDVTGAENKQLQKGLGFNVIGTNLLLGTGSTVTLSWGEGDDATSITISPTINGNELVKFAWPAALSDVAEGTAVKFTFRYVDTDGTLINTITESATIVAAA